MIDPNKLYLSSDQYKVSLDKLGDLIEKEDEERRAGNSVKACEYGLEVWDDLHNLMKMLKANSLYELAKW